MDGIFHQCIVYVLDYFCGQNRLVQNLFQTTSSYSCHCLNLHDFWMKDFGLSSPAYGVVLGCCLFCACIVTYLPGEPSILQVPKVIARPRGELLQNVGSQTHWRIIQSST